MDFPITDVLQMMGRAGRPQFDDQGKAVILVHDIKKDFYKKFLYEPFPVESSLLGVLSDHLNAEIAGGTITSKQDAMDYITWTYFFRRLIMNPSYYSLGDVSQDSINKFLSHLIGQSLVELELSHCIEVGEDNRTIEPLTCGRIASYYYLKHKTVKMFKDRLKPECSTEELLSILSDAEEYTDLPVRHNEDHTNNELAKCLPIELNPHSFDSPHTKAHLLLQAHLSRAMLPCPDYDTDTKTVLDQALRVCQAMLDVAASQGWLVTVLNITHLIQMVIQGRWLKDSSLLTIPNIEQHHLHLFRKWKPPVKSSHAKCRTSIECLPELIHACEGKDHVFSSMVEKELQPAKTKQAWNFLSRLPVINVGISVKGSWDDLVEGHNELSISTLTADKRDENKWIKLHADQEYVLQVSLQRVHFGLPKGKHENHAVTPRFPKLKDEGWFLILGEVDKRELMAVKRVGFVRTHHDASISFFTPETPGRYIFTLYLMSDCYLGLDQQYDIYLNVIKANISTKDSDVFTDLSV